MFPPLGEQEAQLEFWLRMGFEEMATVNKDNPLESLAGISCPPNLAAAAKSISDGGSISSSVARGRTLSASQAGAPVKKMNEELYGAVVLYTGNSIYRALNEALRIKHANVPRYLPYVKLFFAAAQCMPKKAATLWRGIAADLYDEYEPGKVITTNALCPPHPTSLGGAWQVRARQGHHLVDRVFHDGIGGCRPRLHAAGARPSRAT